MRDTAKPSRASLTTASKSFRRRKIGRRLRKKLGCGQVEELIEEAQDELKLIGHMIEWNPRGVPDDYECKVIENDASVPQHIPLHRPGPLKQAISSSRKEDPAIASSEPQAK